MIQKFIIDINLQNERNAFEIQKELTKLTNSKLRLYIDQTLKKFNISKDETFFIPKIEIDLGTINKADYIKAFETKFKATFEKELRKILSTSKKSKIQFDLNKLPDLEKINEFRNVSHIKNSEFFALKFFMLKGYFPWWFDAKNIDLQKLIIEYSKKNQEDFFKLFLSPNQKENKIVLQRIYHILSRNRFEKFIENIISDRYFDQKDEVKNNIRTTLKNISKTESAKLIKFAEGGKISYSQKEIEILKKYKELVSKKEIEEFLRKNFTRDQRKTVNQYLEIVEKSKNIENSKELEKFKANLSSQELKTVEKFIYLSSKSEQKRTLIKELGKSEIEDLLRKNFTRDQRKIINKYLEIVENTKEIEKFEANLSPQELKTIEKFIDLSSKSEQKRTLIKELSLDLFDYDFIEALLFAFFATNTFPNWSEKIINHIKATKQLRTDIEIAEYLFLYISSKYHVKFTRNFYPFISQKEIAIKICEIYPNSFALKILEFLFQQKIELFTKFHQQISQYFQQNTKLDEQKILFILKYYFLVNYKYIFETISEQNIEKLVSEIATKNVYVFIKDLFSDQEIQNSIFLTIAKDEQKIDAYQQLFATLIETGSLSGNLVKISKEQFLLQIKKFSKEFFLEFIQTDRNRFVLVNILPAEIIIMILQKLFAENFAQLNQIWAELNIILRKIKVPNKLKNELQKFLYIIAFELINDKISDKNIWLQKYYASLKSFFEIKMPNKNFEELFFEQINSLQKQRIPVFKNFVYNQKFLSFFSPESQNFIEKNIKLIGFNFIFYLQYGYLHWAFPFINLQKLANLVINNKKQIIEYFGNELLEIINSKFVIKRLFSIFNSRLSEQLIEEINSQEINPKKIIEQEKISKIEELRNLFPDKDLEETYEQIIQEKIDWVNEPEDIEKIYVKNAGLVILCNFLSFLFKRTKLIERKGKKHEFVSPEAQQRAVLLTQYLVTGNENFKEHELILNKIICGVELRQPINVKMQLTDKEKSETEMLLKSVIGHWKILGSTSIQNLRETFLQREGIITLKSNTYNIIVEQKAIDILMTKLPWTFQTIKLSWTDYVIYVEWNV